jgi:hypothetical protein
MGDKNSAGADAIAMVVERWWMGMVWGEERVTEGCLEKFDLTTKHPARA